MMWDTHFRIQICAIVASRRSVVRLCGMWKAYAVMLYMYSCSVVLCSGTPKIFASSGAAMSIIRRHAKYLSPSARQRHAAERVATVAFASLLACRFSSAAAGCFGCCCIVFVCSRVCCRCMLYINLENLFIPSLEHDDDDATRTPK